MKTKSIILFVALLFTFAFILTSCVTSHEHEWENATCEEPKTCKTCGATEGEALGHVEEDVAEQAATCSEAGHTAGKKCSVCDTVLEGMEEIPTIPHTYDGCEDLDCNVCEATREAGEHTYDNACDADCNVCDEERTPADHVYDNACDADCNVCDEERTPADHVYDNACDADCNVCGEERTPADHVYDNACDADCNVCGAERTPADHVYDNACDADCNVCDEERTPADHVYDNACDADCNVCGEERTPANHEYDEEVLLQPTCSATGTKKFTCSVCGDNYTEDVAINPNAHYDVNGDHLCDGCGNTVCGPDLHEAADPVELEGSRVDSSCTVKGSYVSVTYCKHCGTEMSRETVELPLADHTEETIDAVAPTCTTDGSTAGVKCSVCGVTLEAPQVDEATGHSYTYAWAEDNSTCTATCANDASHTETATVSKVTLGVTGEEVTFTYNVEFVNSELAAQSKTINTGSVEIADGVAKINAPAVAGRVASHDYIKVTTDVVDYTFTIYYSEVDVWDGTSVSTGLSGTGSAEDPYLIQSGADLAYVAKVTNEANEASAHSFIGQYLKLTKSIDLNNFELHIGTGSGWGKGFNGFFEGNNCSIRNINNKYPLFGGMYTSWVKNLSLYGKVQSDRNYIAALGSYTFNTTFHNVTNYANITGTNGVGGLVAIMEQNGRTSEGMVNYGNIVATGWLNGGIVGKLGGNLTNSINWGSVTANGDSNVGGIAGGSQDADSWKGTISNCANYGALNNNGKAVAHIIGGNYPKTLVVDCYENHSMTHNAAAAATCEADGNVEYWACSVCKKNYDSENGGNVIANVVTEATGHAWDEGVLSEDGSKLIFTCGNDSTHTREETANYTVTVNHLYLDGSVAAAAETLTYAYNSIQTINAKTIEGYVASHDYVKVHMLENKTVNIYYSEVSVWDGTSVSESLTGSGTEADPYLIQSAADFAYFAGQLNAATVGQTQNFQGQFFKMTKSVDLNSNLLIAGNHSGWNKYQGFGGTFDGNNCTIRNINVSPTTGTSSALFGCITAAGTLKNLIVYGNATGSSTVGGVVAYQLGKVDNVTSYVTIQATAGTIGGVVANQESSAGALTNCVNYGGVTSSSYIVGGIVGSGGATITGCVNWGVVTGGSSEIGGISGTTKTAGTISGCVNYGNVKTTAETTNIGGIVGLCKKAISDCTNYGTVTALAGTTNISGICGSNTSTETDCVNNGTVVTE